MNVMERLKKRSDQTASPSAGIEEKRMPVMQPANQPIKDRTAGMDTSRTTVIDQPFISPGTDTRDWRRAASYDEAAKINPSLSRGQYIAGVSQYRSDNGIAPMSYMELYENLAGKDPFKSAEKEEKQAKGIRRAERVNAIGGVLANLVNYMRTKNGNPAMRLEPVSAGQARIDQMKAYQDALERSHYSDYMNILSQQRAMEAAQDEAARKFQQQVLLEQMKQNSPLALAKVKSEEESLKTEAARQRKLDADIAYTQERQKGQALENRFIPGRAQAELEYTKARKKKTQVEADKAGKKYPKAHIKNEKGQTRDYDLNDDQEVVKFYNLLESRRKNLEGTDNKDDPKRPKTIKEMREYILTTMYKDYPVNDSGGNIQYEVKSNKGLGWGSNNDNNNKTDW